MSPSAAVPDREPRFIEMPCEIITDNYNNIKEAELHAIWDAEKVYHTYTNNGRGEEAGVWE